MFKPLEEKRNGELSPAQLEDARLGFYQLLRRHMSPQWIERHGEDLFGKALVEYSRKLEEGEEIRRPGAFIVTCAWQRTKSALEAERREPQLVSTDVSGPLSADLEEGPEEATLTADRLRQVQDAVAQLSADQRQLLELAYFEEMSVREAGRRLNWHSSKVQRAHKAARKHLHELLGVDSLDELEIIIGLAAYLSFATDHAAGHLLPAGFEAVLDSAHRNLSDLRGKAAPPAHRALEATEHPTRLLDPAALGEAGKAGDIGGRGPLRRLADLGRRLLAGGAGEAGTAAAGEGGSRALEVCKGLAVCVLGGGAVTGALIGGGHQAGRPIAHQSLQARAGRPQARADQHQTAPPRRALVVQHRVVPRAPAPRRTPEVSADSSTPTEKPVPAARHAAPAKPARIEAATPATQTEAAHQEAQEAVAEEQFQNFDSTEESGGESSPVEASSVTDAKTTSETSATSSAEPSPQRRGEEAQAAHEFRGLLE